MKNSATTIRRDYGVHLISINRVSIAPSTYLCDIHAAVIRTHSVIYIIYYIIIRELVHIL